MKTAAISCTLNFIIEDGQLMEAQDASKFPLPVGVNLKAEADPDCDPSQGPCEEWLPGNYTVIVGKYLRLLLQKCLSSCISICLSCRGVVIPFLCNLTTLLSNHYVFI